MGEFNLRDFSRNRIDVQFKDERFTDTLQKWKRCCELIEGGQTARLIILINEDLKKLRAELKRVYD